jgi:hypothetical protein
MCENGTARFLLFITSCLVPRVKVFSSKVVAMAKDGLKYGNLNYTNPYPIKTTIWNLYMYFLVFNVNVKWMCQYSISNIGNAWARTSGASGQVTWH